MRKYFLLLLGTLVFIHVAAQERVSKTEAKVQAVSFANNAQYISRTVSQNDVQEVLPVMEDGDTLLFFVKFNDMSIIVPGVKSLPPVLGCTRFVANTTDDYFAQTGTGYYCHRYKEAVKAAKRNNEQGINPSWLPSSVNDRDRNLYIEPMIETKWGQRISNDGYDAVAYNYYVTETCSACGSGVSPAGCVAVAMGQIMNYYKYPIIRGDRPASQQFDWCNMPDCLLTSSDNYEKERNAVAYLLSECGLASNTNYCYWNHCQSFAAPVNAKNAFVNDFHYSTDADLKRRVFYSDEEWKDMLIGQLSHKHPVFYASLLDDTGSFDYDGHAYICDGYDDETGLFHFNFGWCGNEDEWYNIDDFIVGNDNMNILERAIIDLYPAQQTDLCSSELSLLSYYQAYYNVNGNINPVAYLNVPSSTAVLYSVPTGSSIPSQWRTIPSGATAKYAAHEEIVLQPGFSAEYGSNFTARIEPCPACDETQMLEIGTLTEENTTDTIGTEENSERILLRHSDSTYLIEPSQVRLYPNPTTGKLTVEGLSGATNIQLFDVKGMSVFRWYVESRSEEGFVLNVSTLRQGTYIVRILTKDNKVLIGRFIKE